MNLKRTCLALAAVSALGISANATSLAEALSGGKASGEIRSITEMASDIDSTLVGPYRNANSSAIALQLNYTTGEYNGFSANVGFQHGHSFDIEGDSGAVSSGANSFRTENDGRVTQEGSMLYIANLQYNIAKTEILAGRQLILTPLVAISKANPMLDTFNALSVTSKDLDNTQISAYVIKDWIERYSTTDDSRITHYEDPTLSLYFKNTSISNLMLEGQYLDVQDDVGNPYDAPRATNGAYSDYFFNAEYKLPIDMPLTIGGYIAGASYDGDVKIGATNETTNGGKGETTSYGAKLEGKIAETGFKIAYTKVSDDNSFIGALGHTPHFFKYNGAQMFTDDIFAGQSSVSFMVIPKIIPNVFTLFAYSSYSQTDQGQKVSGVNMDGASELQADIRYKFTKEFDGRLQLAHIELDEANKTDSNMDIGKLYLTYKF